MKSWTDEEVKYLKEHWGKILPKNMKLNRSLNSIYGKANKMKLGRSYNGANRYWTKEEEIYLEESWGIKPLSTICKRLDRTKNAVIVRCVRLGLGPYYESGDYITINQIFNALNNRNLCDYTLSQWIDKGLPYMEKRLNKKTVKVIKLNSFWKWAKKNRTIIDFSNMEENILGKEPDWLKEQRKIDKLRSRQFKKTPWTKAEDNRLIALLKTYKYTYRELSLELKRTEGAIKRRMLDLGIKERPLRKGNHNPWKDEEVEILTEKYYQGHSPDTIANYIDRSAQSIRGKIERMIKNKDLNPRNEHRKSC